MSTEQEPTEAPDSNSQDHRSPREQVAYTQRFYRHESTALRTMARDKGMPINEYVRQAVLTQLTRDGVTP